MLILRKTKGMVINYLNFIEKHFWRDGFDTNKSILANQFEQLGEKLQLILKSYEFSEYINILLVISI